MVIKLKFDRKAKNSVKEKIEQIRAKTDDWEKMILC